MENASSKAESSSQKGRFINVIHTVQKDQQLLRGKSVLKTSDLLRKKQIGQRNDFRTL